MMPAEPSPSSAYRQLLQLALAVCLLIVVSSFRPVSAGTGQDVVPPDPLVETRQLENGMRVWIRPNANPPGRVYMWLHVEAGSLDESDIERGLAHLLEHMAFRNSANFPDGTMFKRFEKYGMRPGVHQNAFTGHKNTTYTLTLPNTRPETITQGLLALSDIAYRLELNQHGLDLERDIVLEEARLRQGPGQRIAEQLNPFLLSGSRYSERAPIGTEQAIRGITLPMVKDFYRRGYQPDRTTLVVVGDVTSKSMLPLIQAQFDGWKKDKTAIAHDDDGVRLYRDTRAIVITEPEIVRARILFTRLRSVPDGYTRADLRLALVSVLAEQAIAKRLERQTTGHQTDVVWSYFTDSRVVGQIRSTQWNVEGQPDKWEKLLAFVVEEQNRLHQHGLLPVEIEEQRREAISRFQASMKSYESVDSMSLMSWLDDGLDEMKPPPDANALLKASLEELPDISAGEINDYVRNWMTPAPQRVAVVLPLRDKSPVPDSEKILGLAKDAMQKNVAPYALQTELPKLLAREPVPGMIAKQSDDSELNITSLEFENGVLTRLRPMTEEKNRINIEIRVSGGRIDETVENHGVTIAATWALLEKATSRLSPSEFDRMLATRNITLSGMPGRDHFLITVETVPGDLEEAMRVVYAVLTDARLDEQVFLKWQERMKGSISNRRYILGSNVNIAANRLFTGSDFRFAPMESGEIGRLTRDVTQKWLSRILRNGSMEVAIVGDFDLKKAVRYSEQYLASLPKRNLPVLSPLEEDRTKYPAGPIEENITVETRTPRAEVYLAWRGTNRKNRQDRELLYLAGKILKRRLMDQIREERGLVYSLGTDDCVNEDFKGNCRFKVQFDTDPGRAHEAMLLARGIVEELVANGPTDEELNIIRKQISTDMQIAPRYIAHWMSWLSGMTSRGDTHADIRNQPTVFDKYTSKDIRIALVKYITSERRITVIGLPKVSMATTEHLRSLERK